MRPHDALIALRIAGYHNDSKAFSRLYVENRISLLAAKQAWDEGRRQQHAGMPCTCDACPHEGTKAQQPQHGEE